MALNYIRANANSVDNKRGRYVQGGTTDRYPTRLGWWDRRDLPTSDTDILVTINARYQFRPWMIAYDYYGQENLEWVILQYNNILDTMEEFVQGAVIRIPTLQRLNLEILSKQSGGKNASET